MGETRKRGIAATPDGLVKLKEAKAAKRNEEGKLLTFENIAEKAGFNESSTVKRFFGSKGESRTVDISSAFKIVQALGLELSEVVDRNDLLHIKKTGAEKSINWREICRQNLAQQKQLTVSPLTSAHGVAPELDKIYVPLALIERKPPKPASKDKTEEKEEEEKLIPIEENCFFENVLRREQSKNSQGRRIAIIGEPGSGKTTRLQKIADWILEKDLGLPILISLGDLTQPTITHHIEEIWLKKNGQSIKIDKLTQHKQQIWLLLDGLDEMTSRVEMRHFSALLGGWVEEARVVVTCRVNVWEADKNAFLGFDVFRNLPFNLEQIETFIHCWFKDKEANFLIQALHQPGQERLLDLVRNPLCLSLLCQTWNGSSLPDTQAQLYENYLKHVYKWNRNLDTLREQATRCKTNITDLKKQLNKQLGELAKAALDSYEERFRLSQGLVEQYLGEEIDEQSLCHVALGLGWLNRVGMEEQCQSIFAFYHPTFQEYFAALAVEDWDYFLPRNHVDCPVAGKKYRIFKRQWKQVILFWIGRKKQKKCSVEKFIEQLIEFQDGCGNFYGYQAYLLAGLAIGEFKICTASNKIIKRIVRQSFGYFNFEKQEWRNFAKPIKSNSRSVLFRTNRTLVTRELISLLKSERSEENLIEVIEALTNSKDISINPDSTPTRQGFWVHFWRNLKKESEEVIEILKCLIYSNISISPSIVVVAIQLLGVINKNNLKAKIVLKKLLIDITPEKFSCNFPENWPFNWDGYLYCLRQEILRNLKEQDDSNSSFETDLLQFHCIDRDRNPSCYLGNIERFERYNKRHSLLKTLENQKITNSEHLMTRIQFAREHEEDETILTNVEELWSIYKGNQTAIDCLINLIKDSEDEWIHQYAVSALVVIGKDNKKAINTLIKLVEITELESIRLLSLQGLGQIGKEDLKLTDFLIELIKNCSFSTIYFAALKSLLEIAPNNLTATQTYTQLISNHKDKEGCFEALRNIHDTKICNCEIKETILITMYNAESEDIRELAAETLWNISPGHSDVITVLSNLYKNSQDKSFSEYIYKMRKLKGFLTNSKAKVMKDVVTVFKGDRSDEMMENDAKRFVGCYEVLFHCAQNLSYPDFYNAWHSNTSNSEPVKLN
ncbi:MAG: NACHT domain-containing protein [Cyanobacteriota bacterium]|nr:NACHT domain-containing protein [Cyanobacteriota bacterium]